MPLFGGNWTEKKLNCLKQYIMAYEKVMKNQPFKLLYIDAFAGSGYREVRIDTDDARVGKFLQGSPYIVLENTESFSSYIFVEKDQETFSQLKNLKDSFPKKPICFENADANIYIKELCQKTDWKSHRAVLFLDPFAMEVEWGTIQSIADTKAIDIWFLFPAMAVNRLLFRDKQIPENMCRKLNKVFGTEDWRQEFYQEASQLPLFDKNPELEKIASFETIKSFYLKRLRTIFAGVADNPLPLKNKRKSILFYLCFAVSNINTKAQGIALKIAQHILVQQ